MFIGVFKSYLAIGIAFMLPIEYRHYILAFLVLYSLSHQFSRLYFHKISPNFVEGIPGEIFDERNGKLLTKETVLRTYSHIGINIELLNLIHNVFNLGYICFLVISADIGQYLELAICLLVSMLILPLFTMNIKQIKHLKGLNLGSLYPVRLDSVNISESKYKLPKLFGRTAIVLTHQGAEFNLYMRTSVVKTKLKGELYIQKEKTP